ncbi:MAG: hypothetical protein H0T66_04595 [Geodermatophilaceae bacterium]|nr:hypothetical protein [Geodermatophilaceae bacterium]MDQ3456571.1 hypothetical protein [Actinomycetota bacterium]
MLEAAFRGALTFFAGDGLVEHHGGRDRKRSGGQQRGAAMGLVLCARLDGIPESAAMSDGSIWDRQTRTPP